MKISVLNRQIQAAPVDAIIINLFEGVSVPGGATGAVDTALGASDGVPGSGSISKLIQLGDFKGKLNELAVLYGNGLIPATRIIVVGLGKQSEFDVNAARHASATAVRKARDLGCKRVATIAHGAGIDGLSPRSAAQATIEGAVMGVYQHLENKSQVKDNKTIDELMLLTADANQISELTEGANVGETIGIAVNTARTLANRPPNQLHPASFAEFAQNMAAHVGLRCEVFDENEIKTHGMGGITAVSQGSAQPARFVVLEHQPKTNNGKNSSDEILPPIVLVGKGVTFDTGGISIKPSEGMQSMKGDMAGAAAVIGAMQAIAMLNLSRHVIGLVPMVENMPSDRAYRPSDVITMMSGLTVEIISTDAEGRMILADALHYAKRFSPSGVVDIATLTGSCVIALGEGVAAGVFASDDHWANTLLSASATTGERIWRMPLYKEYGDAIKSDTADIKNSGGRMGGVGTSAWFLRRFVEGEDGQPLYPWAHIDMAAMDTDDKTDGYRVKGGSGFGVRLFVHLIQNAQQVK
jgi:leucyl aminopeptidase